MFVTLLKNLQSKKQASQEYDNKEIVKRYITGYFIKYSFYVKRYPTKNSFIFMFLKSLLV